jgi:hypothetical protein
MAKDASQTAEANRLYWNNEASVGEIATRLNISRRALYELLEPRPADVPCSECGTDTVFVNRSSLTSGLARCPSCEAETAVPASRSERERNAGIPATVTNSQNSAAPPLRLTLGGAALAGAVLGAVATFIITRRD